MPIRHSPLLLWLLLLFAACALLRAPVAQAKTASGPFYGADTLLLRAAVREAAPRLGLPGSTTICAPDVPDTNNRQLHPNEVKWIKDHAKRFAQQQGISEAEAEKRLAQQAFREVQFGVEGQTDVAAQAFLKNNTRGMLLPGDPNAPGQNVGFMFYAKPDQKANATMYLSQMLNSPATLSFYRDNQLKQPSLQQIVNAVQSDSAKRADVLNKTVMAAVAAGALTLAPAFAGTAAEVAAFSKNPVGYCLANPAGCTVAAETVTCAMAGGACPATSMVPNVRSATAKVVEKEVADATKAVNVAVNEAKAAKGGTAAVDDAATTASQSTKYVDILSPEAKQHILYGDGPGSGGHLWPGQPGKTVFPQDWSADKAVHEIGDIATSPATQWYAQTGTGGIYTKAGDPAKWVAYEVRDGVRIRVVYEPATGRVVTAFPDNNPIPNYKPIKK